VTRAQELQTQTRDNFPLVFGAAILLLLARVAMRAPAELAFTYVLVLAASLTFMRRSDSDGSSVVAVAIAGIGAVVLASLLLGPRLTTSTLPAVGLAAAAAVAEEALFRGALYQRMAGLGPPLAISLSALAFAAAHVPLYGWSALPVDLGAGLLFGWQRAASGSWAPPAATHVVANLLAVLR
jgi:membrane protease YdiL (CAAX protease family)